MIFRVLKTLYDQGIFNSRIYNCSLHTEAQARFFARTYTTNILEKGNIDLEFKQDWVGAVW